MDKEVLPGKIGEISAEVISALSLSVDEGTPIFLGETNINHILKRHPVDFGKYGEYIELIVRCPDYVGLNPKDQSIEYVKEFLIENEFVKVAVRVSASGKYFARSLYVLNTNRVNNFISNGSLRPLTKCNE